MSLFSGDQSVRVNWAQDRLCCTISAIGRAAIFEGFSLRDRVREGDSERCEAIEDGNPDMDFGNLAV